MMLRCMGRYNTHKDSASEAAVVLSNFVLRLVAATVMAAGMFAGTMVQALTRPFPALLNGLTHMNTNHKGRASVCLCYLNERWTDERHSGTMHLPQQRQSRRVG